MATHRTPLLRPPHLRPSPTAVKSHYRSAHKAVFWSAPDELATTTTLAPNANDCVRVSNRLRNPMQSSAEYIRSRSPPSHRPRRHRPLCIAQLSTSLLALLLLLLWSSSVQCSSSSSYPRHPSPLQTAASNARSSHKSSHTHHRVHHTSSSSSSSSTPKTTNAPEFVEPMRNVTMPVGKDVVFECVVDNLGSYKLAWLKVDHMNARTELPSALALTEPEIISIQTQIVLNNASVPGHGHHQSGQQSSSLQQQQQQSAAKESRYRVSHTNHRQWFLHIKSIKPSDRGYYMCQINTEPIISQAAFLDILIAPSIDYNATSSDAFVDERHRLSIRCKAKGYPPPTIIWRREDNKDINLGQYGGKRYSASKVEGEFLNITQVTRDDMGAYLCIASNSVQPSVSKRIIVRVNFRPKIKVSNQLVGSMIGSDVQLECRCEASPQPTTNWIRSDGQVLVASAKYQMREEHDSYRTKMKLLIHNLDEKDFGSYKCVAKNAIGEKEGLVRLYEIAPPASTAHPGDPSNPTFIYSYQGRQNGISAKFNLTHSMLGDHKNFDYSDYQQASTAAASVPIVACLSLLLPILTWRVVLC